MRHLQVWAQSHGGWGRCGLLEATGLGWLAPKPWYLAAAAGAVCFLHRGRTLCWQGTKMLASWGKGFSHWKEWGGDHTVPVS